jgi:hypothetical protein
MLVVLWLFDKVEDWARVRLGLPEADAIEEDTRNKETP